jgi:hypothetical protein
MTIGKGIERRLSRHAEGPSGRRRPLHGRWRSRTRAISCAKSYRDFDIWIAPGKENAERVHRALLEFGAPLVPLGITLADLAEPGHVIQLGVAPRRIDLLTALSGLEFEAAEARRVVRRIDDMDIPFIGRQDLIRNKRATGRLRDLADVEMLDDND